MKTLLIALLSALCLVSLPLSAQQKESPNPVASSNVTFSNVSGTWVHTTPAKAAGPAPSTSIQVSDKSANAILKAEHELDLIKSDEADISQQFQALQHQADQLSPRVKEDQTKEAAALAKVEAALEAVYAANGVTKDKYNFDPANFTLTEKPPTPVKAASSPVASPATTAAAKPPSK